MAKRSDQEHRNRTGQGDERRNRILQTALYHFAVHGYARTSTNRIAAEAGTAKGLVFHYFGSKRNLFLGCLQLVLDTFGSELCVFLSVKSPDFIQRMQGFLRLKKMWLQQHPMEYRLLARLPDLPVELQAAATKCLDRWQGQQRALVTDLDETPWNPQVNPNQVIEMVALLTEGIDQRWLSFPLSGAPEGEQDGVVKNSGDALVAWEEHLQRVLEEALTYLEILRQGIYRG